MFIVSIFPGYDRKIWRMDLKFIITNLLRWFEYFTSWRISNLSVLFQTIFGVKSTSSSDSQSLTFTLNTDYLVGSHLASSVYSFSFKYGGVWPTGRQRFCGSILSIGLEPFEHLLPG